MSANKRLTEISAPKTPSLFRSLMQLLQIAGLPGNRPKPTCRSTAPPGPSNGAAQSLQLGPWGTRRMIRRTRTRPGSSPERNPRIASSGVDGRGIAALILLGVKTPSREWRRGLERDGRYWEAGWALML